VATAVGFGFGIISRSGVVEGNRMEPLRVAVIGRTGRGDWGHAIDELWRDIEAAELVAVADENEEGLGQAVARLRLDATKPGTAHRDWRKMLAEVKPDVVAICMRHLDCHAEMAIAAAAAGVKGIFLEKPFVRTPAEADAALEAHIEARGLLCPLMVRACADAVGIFEVVDGNRQIASPYALAFKTDVVDAKLCTRVLTPDDVARLRASVLANWYAMFVFDGLPIYSFLGRADADEYNPQLHGAQALLLVLDALVYVGARRRA
jgi:hypothetical protein